MNAHLILAACLLPLFPFSMLFNAVFARIRQPLARAVLLLAWPQAGLWVVQQAGGSPDWIAPWALATALLYAVRALSLRDAGQWIGFLATALGALVWVRPDTAIVWAFFVPLALLALITGAVVTRYGAAYAGYPDALALRSPRLAGVFAVAVLVATGTPPFAGFFAWIALALAATPAMAMSLLAVWLVWSWAAIRLIQGLVVGEAAAHALPGDLGRVQTWMFALTYAGVLLGGLWLAGELI
ncbi:MAG: hypothetical protein ACK4UX_08335 [Thiobacillus sp.]